MNIPDLFALTTGQKPLPQSFSKSAVANTLDQANAPLTVAENEETVTVDAAPAAEDDVSPTEPISEAPPVQSGEEFQTFLTLLTAQIRNQDPLAPLDSTQFVEQLATFTNLELQAKGNQSLDTISAQLAQQLFALQTLTQNLSPAEP